MNANDMDAAGISLVQDGDKIAVAPLTLAQRRKALDARMEAWMKEEEKLDKLLDELDDEDQKLEREEKAARKALKKAKTGRDTRKISPKTKRAARSR